MQFLHQMFNVSALLLDDAQSATALANGAINETPRHTFESPDSDSEIVTMGKVKAYKKRCQFMGHHVYAVAIYRVVQKWQSFWYALTSSNINRFSKLFHCQNQEKMCNNTITKYPTTPQMRRYTTL